MHSHAEEAKGILLVRRLYTISEVIPSFFFLRFSVPHDRLFLDALERDLKREKMGLESTTAVVSEPALSFSYDPKRPLFEQFVAATKSRPDPVEADAEGSPPTACQTHVGSTANGSASSVSLPELDYPSARSSLESHKSSVDRASVHTEPPTPSRAPLNPLARSPFFNMFALFEGSPTYKQRRKKSNKARRNAGDEDRDSVRHGLDSSRHSLDSSRPNLRPQPRSYTTFLAGPGQFGFTSAVSGFPPLAQVGRLGKQLRAQRALPALSAPNRGHHCPLYTCARSFSDAESLQSHIRIHEYDNQRANIHQGDMDVDRREGEDENTYPYVQCVRGTQQLECPRGSPEIPHFTHVLTSPGCDYEDEKAYHTPGDWTPQSAESPGYSGAVSASVASPGYAIFHICMAPI